MAVLTNMLARFRWSVSHYGPHLGNLALDALAAVLADLRALLRSNADEAKAVEAGASSLVAAQHAAAEDGVIDAHERRALAKRSAEFLKLTHAHRNSASDLAT